MKLFIMCAALYCIMAGCRSTLNELTWQEKKDGWQLLFDGKTTNGWHNFNQSSIGSAWKILDGTLYLDTSQKDNWQVKGGGDIVHETTVDNFHLKVEWKIAAQGNSGIMFYVQENAGYQYPWQSGPEMQVLDNEGHPDGKIIKHRAGDLYDLISSDTGAVKKPGEWNVAEIISLNGDLVFKLNGTQVLRTTLWNDNWRNLIANSKFNAMPGFGSFKKGKISLQDHGNRVWFRNMKLKKF